MKILITGVNGQLGLDVVRELVKRNITSSITEGNTESITKYEIIATDVVLPDFCFRDKCSSQDLSTNILSGDTTNTFTAFGIPEKNLGTHAMFSHCAIFPELPRSI